MFSLDVNSGEAGTLVKVAAGNLSLDPVSYVTRNTANGGWAAYSHATSRYPEVPLKVTAATAIDTGNILGVMLRDVRETDENGEKLLFYPEKREEMQCVLSGQAVPVCNRGRFTVLVAKGFSNGVAPSVGNFVLPAANGRFTGVSATAATAAQQSQKIGLVLGTGNRVSQQDTDEFAGSYALLQLSL
jgi:hypothetical protein